MKKKEKIMQVNLAIEEYLNSPKGSISLSNLGKKYGIRRQLISEILKSRGIDVINYQNLSRINENIFDKIDTEEKAYWLGFIYADGCITFEGNRLEIRLSSKDEDHLMKFTNFIGDSCHYRHATDGIHSFVHYSVRNKHIWNILNDYGCTPRKSLTVEFPNENIFKHLYLIRDFIRGYCDGDGSLGIYPIKNKNRSLESLGFCGSKSFLYEMDKYFPSHSNVYEKKDNKIHVLKYAALKARQNSFFMYENSTIYMERKYNVFKSFCRLELENPRLQRSKNGESWNANPVVNSLITKGKESL